VTVSAADERRHPGVAETWWFDLSDPARAFGVVARLTYHPLERVGWWWVGVVGAGWPLVALRAHDVPIPARGTEIRTDGLWASVRCETPLEHWTVGLECFAVAYDDPWEAARSERGDVVPFGLDLSFVTSSPAWSSSRGYGEWCTVSGEVLLGDERLSVDTVGSRAHAWGEDGLPSPFMRVRGRGTPGAVVGLCPFKVPDGVWVESLCAASGPDGAGGEGEGEGGWVGAPASPPAPA